MKAEHSRAARVAAMRAVFAALCDSDGGAGRDILFDLPERESESDQEKAEAARRRERDIVNAAHRRGDIVTASELPEAENENEGEGGRKKSSAKMRRARGIAAAFVNRRKDINAMVAAAATYAPEDITLAERALICAGAAEMLAYPQTPRAVVINEFVEIAKQYGIDGGAKLVNGVLDGVARNLRSHLRSRSRLTREDAAP